MKKLFENWRQHLNERFGPEWTVGYVRQLIDAGREEEGDRAMGELAKGLGRAFVEDFLPSWEGKGALGAVGDYYRKQRSRQGQGVVFIDDPKKHPILDLLDMNPVYTHFIREDWLLGIDEEYEKYLDGLSYDTIWGDVKDIDEFINDRIHRESQGVITITNRSADWKDPWAPQ